MRMPKRRAKGRHLPMRHWKLYAVFTVSALLLAAPVTKACVLQLVDIDMTVVCVSYTGGMDCWVTYYEYYGCVEPGGGGGPGGGDPGGGPVYQPPPPPQISIVSMNDQNPGNPVLSIQTANVHHVDFYINGYRQNSYPGDTSTIILPTLDPNTTPFRGESGLELRAFNSVGTSSSAYLGISRPTSQANVQAGMFVRYYETGPGGIVLENHVDMTRSLTTLIVYTSYSCPTVGARNGRIFHWTSEDVLGWEGFRPDPVWVSRYRMTSLPYPQQWEEEPCNARFAGPSYQSGMCVTPYSFAADGSPSATAAIATFGMGAFLQYPTYIVPNEITLTPE